MNVRQMSLSWISASDIKKSKQFFAETLGLTVINSAEEHGWLELQGQDGGMVLGIGAAGGDECEVSSLVKPGQNAVVTMTIDNIIAAKTELEAKGVQFIGNIIEVPGHVKMIFFVDPDGNKFQLVENLDGK